MPRSAPLLELAETDAAHLRQWVSAFGTPQQVCLRSQIVLAAAERQSASAVAQQLEINRKTVMLWRDRFEPYLRPSCCPSPPVFIRTT